MQQRAENGVRERVIGYIGSDWTPEPEDIDLEAIAAFGGAYELSLEQLPESIRDIVEVENHRMTTGETLRVEEFKKRKGVTK